MGNTSNPITKYLLCFNYLTPEVVECLIYYGIFKVTLNFLKEVYCFTKMPVYDTEFPVANSICFCELSGSELGFPIPNNDNWEKGEGIVKVPWYKFQNMSTKISYRVPNGRCRNTTCSYN